MIADELLELAASLANTNATQAAIRRSISTSYYALFHLLIQDASRLWPGTDAEKVTFERAFNHGTMKAISKQFAAKSWINAFDVAVPVQLEIRRVADAFTFLQEYRHKADYLNSKHFRYMRLWRLLSPPTELFKIGA